MLSFSFFLYVAGKKDGFGSGIVVDPSTDIYHGTGYYQGHWKKNCRSVDMPFSCETGRK